MLECLSERELAVECNRHLNYDIIIFDMHGLISEHAKKNLKTVTSNILRYLTLSHSSFFKL